MTGIEQAPSNYWFSFYSKNKNMQTTYFRNYSADNRDRLIEYYRSYYLRNKERLLSQGKIYVLNNKQKTKKYKHQWYLNNKHLTIERQKQRYANNKNEKKAYDLMYNKKNAEKKREQKKQYSNKKIKTSPLFKLTITLRHRIYIALKNNGYKKECKTHILLGADFDVVKKHIEGKFKDEMTWGNHGTWHIDHIIPLSSAKTAEDLIKLFHYTNMQPLWAKENLIKSNKINLEI